MTFQRPLSGLAAVPPAFTTAPLTAAAAIARVATWHDLPATRRRDLASHLSVAARMAGLPPDALVLSPGELRARVLDRSAAGHGLSLSGMRNVLSGLRHVLRRLDLIDPADGPLDPAWEVQLDRLIDDRRRAGLRGFARFCSRHAVAPAAVTVGALRDFEAHLAGRTLCVDPSKAAGAVRGGWNRACKQVPGWAGAPIGRRGRRNPYVLPLDAFPAGFREDLDRFAARLAATGPTGWGDAADAGADDAPLSPRKPLRPSTIALRRDHVRWAASALVASGVPVREGERAITADDITSLAELVRPLDRTRAAIRLLHDRAGGQPSAAGTHVAEALRIVARHHVGLPEAEVAQIKRWGGRVALHYRGMTERNERDLRVAMLPQHLERLLVLPKVLMAAAARLRETAPEQARSLALRAVAVGLLTKLPVRLANLAGLRLDRHLHRPDPRRGRVAQLMIPAEDTKTRRAITLPVPPDVAELIEQWLTLHRRPSAPGCLWLFPNQARSDRPISHQGLREAVKDATRTQVGAELSPHQFRHLAAKLFLEAFPGHYEAVRQLLGHASVATTTRHYSGEQAGACARRYDREVLGARRPAPAPTARRGRR